MMNQTKMLLDKVVSGTIAMDLYTYDPVAGLKGIIPGDHPIWTNKRSTWDWGQGVALSGLIESVKLTGHRQAIKEVERFVQLHLNEGLPQLTVNTTIPYLTLLWLYERTGEETYLKLVLDAAEYCRTEAERTPDGLLVHTTLHADFPQEIWVDTMFMSGLVWLEVWRLTGHAEYASEAAGQIMGHVRTLYDADNHLFFHAYRFIDQAPVSQVHWGRGNSWATIIMAEALIRQCVTGSDRDLLLHIYRDQVDRLLELQDSNGLWHTVLDEPWTYLESSCSAGFCFAILLGLNHGLIAGSAYEQAVERTFQALHAHIDDGGRVFSTSAGTGHYPDASSYNAIPTITIQPWGQGLTLLFLQEKLKRERLSKEEHLN